MQAGLFSAVNSAFVIVALGNLSANPLDQTNNLLQLIVMHANNNTLTAAQLNPLFVPTPSAVRQNCMFLASLASSLLAATGAVLAKQWLVAYERTGQTGSLEKQGIRRTEKFFGAESWRLQPVVEALPTLLLLSLALFSVALADFLWSINKSVAITVCTFAAIGAAFYAITVLAAVISKQCPFQTAPSVVLRNSVLLPIIRIMRTAKPTALKALLPSLQWLMYTSFWQALSIDHDRIRRWIYNQQDALRRSFWVKATHDPEEIASDMVYARSAVWMMETAPDPPIILAISRNVPALADFEAVKLIARNPSCKILIRQCRAALVALEMRQTEDNNKDALSCLKTVAYLLLVEPKRWTEMVEKSLVHDDVYVGRERWDDTINSLTSPDLKLIYYGIRRLCAGMGSVYFLSSLRGVSWPDPRGLDQVISTRSEVAQSTLIIFEQLLTLSQRIPATRYGSDYVLDHIIPIQELLLMKQMVTSSPLIHLASKALLHSLKHISTGRQGWSVLPPWDQVTEDVWFTLDLSTDMIRYKYLAIIMRYFD